MLLPSNVRVFIYLFRGLVGWLLSTTALKQELHKERGSFPPLQYSLGWEQCSAWSSQSVKIRWVNKWINAYNKLNTVPDPQQIFTFHKVFVRIKKCNGWRKGSISRKLGSILRRHHLYGCVYHGPAFSPHGLCAETEMRWLPRADGGTATASYLLWARNPDDRTILIMLQMRVNVFIVFCWLYIRDKSIQNRHQGAKSMASWSWVVSGQAGLDTSPALGYQSPHRPGYTKLSHWEKLGGPVILGMKEGEM